MCVNRLSNDRRPSPVLCTHRLILVHVRVRAPRSQGNKKYGVQSKTGGHPTVRNNRIHDKVYGIYLTESGGGIYEENRIHNIRGTGIFVSADCSPVLANNHGTS